MVEPTADGGALKTARKGTGRFEVVVHGKAAHAGLEPEKGINSLIAAAELIRRIATFGDPATATTVTPTVATRAPSTTSCPPRRGSSSTAASSNPARRSGSRGCSPRSPRRAGRHDRGAGRHRLAHRCLRRHRRGCSRWRRRRLPRSDSVTCRRRRRRRQRRQLHRGDRRADTRRHGRNRRGRARRSRVRAGRHDGRPRPPSHGPHRTPLSRS